MFTTPSFFDLEPSLAIPPPVAFICFFLFQMVHPRMAPLPYIGVFSPAFFLISAQSCLIDSQYTSHQVNLLGLSSSVRAIFMRLLLRGKMPSHFTRPARLLLLLSCRLPPFSVDFAASMAKVDQKRLVFIRPLVDFPATPDTLIITFAIREFSPRMTGSLFNPRSPRRGS